MIKLVTWVKVQIFDHVVEKVGVVVTHGCFLDTYSPGHECLETLGLTIFIGRSRISPSGALVCGLSGLATDQASRHCIYYTKAETIASPSSRSSLVSACTAHKKLQGATVMVEIHTDLEVLREYLMARTLSKVHQGRGIVQLMNMGPAVRHGLSRSLAVPTVAGAVGHTLPGAPNSPPAPPPSAVVETPVRLYCWT